MKRILTAGLTILVPFVTTLYILKTLLHKLTRPFVYELKNVICQLGLPLKPDGATLHLVVQVLLILTFALFVLLIGFATKWAAIQALVHKWQSSIKRLPLIRLVYDPLEKALQKLLDPKVKVFTGPRILEIDPIKALSVGIGIGGDPLLSIESIVGEPVEIFLLPGVPNPLMGFIIFSPKSRLKESPFNLEETVKYLVSCGLIHPKSLQEAS